MLLKPADMAMSMTEGVWLARCGTVLGSEGAKMSRVAMES